MLLQLFLMLLLEASPVLQVLEKARPQDYVSHSRLLTSSPTANTSPFFFSLLFPALPQLLDRDSAFVVVVLVAYGTLH